MSAADVFGIVTDVNVGSWRSTDDPTVPILGRLCKLDAMISGGVLDLEKKAKVDMVILVDVVEEGRGGFSSKHVDIGVHLLTKVLSRNGKFVGRTEVRVSGCGGVTTGKEEGYGLMEVTY